MAMVEPDNDIIFQAEASLTEEPERPLVCGLDEAGRGPLAGPLVAALVAFPTGFDFVSLLPKHRLRDSKQLSAHQREELFALIHETALVVNVETISVEEINTANIGWANRSAFERLIMQVDAFCYIVDGNLKLTNLGRRKARIRCQVRADAMEPAVAAASIIAKVTRDRMMLQLHQQYPQYGWDHNVGYGTPAHLAALDREGISPYHRTQFVNTALANLRTRRLPGFDVTDPPEE